MTDTQNPADHRTMEPYVKATPAAQAGLDTVFRAIQGMDTGYRGVGIDHRSGDVTASFRIPQAAGEDRAYTAYVSSAGEFQDLRVIEHTGRMVTDPDTGDQDEVIRSVRVRPGGSLADVLLRAFRDAAK